MTSVDTERAVIEDLVSEMFDKLLRETFSRDPDDQLRADAMEFFPTLKDRERDILARIYGLVSGKRQYMTVVARDLKTTPVRISAIKTRAQSTLRRAVRLKYEPDSWYWPRVLPSAVTPPEELRIEEADFSVRTYNCLKRAGINLIGELVKATEEELLNLRNFGRKQFTEVNEKLVQFGLEGIPNTSER